MVEVSAGVPMVGGGMAACLPGALLRDLGADVVRVESGAPSTLDYGVKFGRVWNRGKHTISAAEGDLAAVVNNRVADADVVFLSGAEAAIEQRGIGTRQLGRKNPRLVAVRVRPSYNAGGAMPDLELLVAARAGLMTQIRGHESGRPVFPDLAVGQAGAAVSAAVAALVGLYERAATGSGRWAETSLYDGMMATLPMIIGRVENHSPSTRLLWQQQGPAESICYRCADGRYVQLWFGAKGAYEQFLEKIGDAPTEVGYNAELISGRMVERGRRWSELFSTEGRDWWVEELAGHSFRCEPVLRPGEALRDDHTRAVGLAVDCADGTGPLTVVGPPVSVTAVGTAALEAGANGGRLLSGVKVLDLSAFLAGPVAALVMAELGADVVKVEPLTGDVHRAMEPMFAAGQRGKRTVALDLKSPGAPLVLQQLFEWADVVHHNSRLGVAERLGYDEPTARAANPDLVYSFASGFGETGPKASLPANDQLIQALSGIEHGQAGEGRPPSFLVWGAVDVVGGWLAACGILAGLYARRVGRGGQSVRSSLYGAGLTLKSGAHLDGGSLEAGPSIDDRQMGYGVAYRIYRGGDDRWFALAIGSEHEWRALREVTGAEIPAAPPPLRTAGSEPQPEELVLEAVFAGRPAAQWIAVLADAGLAVEAVVEVDREGFVAGFVDDPVNRQLNRVVTYQWGARGKVDQLCFPPRLPSAERSAAAHIAGLGQHTAEVLAEAGIGAEQQAELAAGGTLSPT